MDLPHAPNPAVTDSTENPASKPASALRAIRLEPLSRGVVIAGLLTSAVLSWGVLLSSAGRDGGSSSALLSMLIGMFGGSVVSFSRSDVGDSDLTLLLTDAALVTAWVVLLTSAFNFLYGSGFGSTGNLALPPGKLAFALAFAGIGVVPGTRAGPPVLRRVGQLSIMGRQPFVAVISATKGIQDSNTRFVVRVLALSAMTIALIALAYMVIIVALVILAIVAAFAIFGAATSGGTSSGGGSRSSDEDEDDHRSTYSPPRRSGGSWFSAECTNCGSTEHTSSDCPHGMFSGGKCGNCGSTEHATGDCPHGIFSGGKCGNCGSTDHASGDCPHGIFSGGKCGNCGSLNHATGDCPHGMFSGGSCARCGSVDHATNDCPH